MDEGTLASGPTFVVAPCNNVRPPTIIAYAKVLSGIAAYLACAYSLASSGELPVAR